MNVSEFIEAAGNANAWWLLGIALAFTIDRSVGWAFVFFAMAVHLS